MSIYADRSHRAMRLLQFVRNGPTRCRKSRPHVVVGQDLAENARERGGRESERKKERKRERKKERMMREEKKERKASERSLWSVDGGA